MSGITNPVHLAFIAVIALVVLGPKRLPDLAKTLGNGLREFRDAISVEGTRAPSTPAPAVEVESTYPVAPAAAPPPDAHVASAPAPAEQELAATATAAPTPAEQELAAPPPSA